MNIDAKHNKSIYLLNSDNLSSEKIEEIFELFNKDRYWFIMGRVALHKNCPISILEKLANNEDWYIRSALASNINCPTYLLEKLSNDIDNKVRVNIALNNSCPYYILEKLYKEFPIYVSKHKNCPDYLKIFSV